MCDDTEWVIIDTETDGLYFPIHVVEVAAQRMRGLAPDGEPFQVFLNHNIPIPPEAHAIHGYTRDFLSEHGVTPQLAHNRLRDYIGSRAVSSHCLSFDWNRVLLPEWNRLGVAPSGLKHINLCVQIEMASSAGQGEGGTRFPGSVTLAFFTPDAERTKIVKRGTHRMSQEDFLSAS